jgi:segregation and condensation protein B
MELEKQIEAILFYRGEPLKVKAIAKIFSVKESAVRDALNILSENLENRGIRLLQKDNSVMLGTAPEMGEIIEAARKEELSRDLGKAGLETLSIILYKGPISRAEIDYIRGVNSAFILRNLMIRALIERETNPKDSRSFLYKPTFELLQVLGVTSIDELPNFEKVKEELESFIKESEEENEEGSSNPFVE